MKRARFAISLLIAAFMAMSFLALMPSVRAGPPTVITMTMGDSGGPVGDTFAVMWGSPDDIGTCSGTMDGGFYWSQNPDVIPEALGTFNGTSFEGTPVETLENFNLNESLLPSTTYYFRAWLSGDCGFVTGDAETFTTLATPTPCLDTALPGLVGLVTLAIGLSVLFFILVGTGLFGEDTSTLMDTPTLIALVVGLIVAVPIVAALLTFLAGAC